MLLLQHSIWRHGDVQLKQLQNWVHAVSTVTTVKNVTFFMPTGVLSIERTTGTKQLNADCLSLPFSVGVRGKENGSLQKLKKQWKIPTLLTVESVRKNKTISLKAHC